MVRRLPEEKHAQEKKNTVNDTGYQYPPEQLVLLDKAVCFAPRLNCYDDFFEQIGKLVGKYTRTEFILIYMIAGI